MRFKLTLLALGLVVSTACAAKYPASYTTQDITIVRANEATVAIGEIQHAAIELNKIPFCSSTGNTGGCVPLLSTDDTRTVVEVATPALKVIRATPMGWKATATTALGQMQTRLSAAGRTRLAAYMKAATDIINAE